MREDIVLVDTSGWICFFSRKGFPEIKKAIAILLEENRIATTGPVLVELIQGCRNEAEKRAVENAVQGMHWLSVHDAHWHQASQLAFTLRRKAITLSVVDALIATTAIAYHCTLLHRDQDYAQIVRHDPRLQLHSIEN